MVFEPAVRDLVWKRSYLRWRWRDALDVAAQGLPPMVLAVLVAILAAALSAGLRLFLA